MFTTLTGFPGSLFDELDRIERERDRFFSERGLSSSIRAAAGRGFPPLNVGATPEAMEVFVFLPGVDASSLEITLDKGVLTIRGERSATHNGVDREYRRRERANGTFMRQFTLPETVDAEHISATVTDGVLEIVIAKAQKPQPKKISVN